MASKKEKILVVDDDLRMRELLAEILAGAGFRPVLAGDGEAALQLLEQQEFALVITDLKMPGADGMEVLESARRRDRDRPVLLISAYGTVPDAMSAMRLGVFDFLEKPFEHDSLLLAVERAVDHFRLVTRNRELDETISQLQCKELIGSSRAIGEVKNFIAKVAPLDVSVLIQGETGTGKELVARLLHDNSRRANQRFLPINCGALPENLLESELFGHEKGAFTGADHSKPGLVEQADGGTLFLDEVHTMPAACQVKILRFLQDHRYMRVGGSGEARADVRVVAAANADLRREIAAGRFREDLFYRLNLTTVHIPPLRQRPTDLPELAYFFLRRAARLYDKDIRRIDEEVLTRMRRYHWPGNVRELENCISSGVIMSEGPTLNSLTLPAATELDTDSGPAPGTESPAAGICTLEEMERDLIQRALETTGHNRAAAARLLGIDSSTLWRKLKRSQRLSNP